MISENTLLEIKNSRTLKNLVELFANEAQTLIRYQRFASTARHEGFQTIAEMFERLSQNQTIVVEGHLDFLRNISDPLSGLPLGPTTDNLNAALAAEATSQDIYSSATRMAEDEGFVDIASWLRSTAASKRIHQERISAAVKEISETGEP